MARSPGRRSGWWRDATIRRRLLLAVLACCAFGAMLLVGVWTRACAGERCPSISVLDSYDPDQASIVYAADGRPIGSIGTERRDVIPLKEMSPAIPAAFLATEDRRFYQHHGVDWRGWVRVFADFLRGRGMTGASTITMQLAGNIFPQEINRNLRGIRGIPRKIREMRVAMEIEKRYSKDKILELYLNKIWFGNGAYGVEAAAQRYFGKSARQLNVAEAAMLARLPKNPGGYNPRVHPAAAVSGRNTVIDLMRDAGRITPAEAEQWKAYPLALSARSDYSYLGEYFVEYVRLLLDPRFDHLNTGGYRIYTTLDLDAQEAAERALEAQLERIENSQLEGQRKWKRISYEKYLDSRKEGDPIPSQSPYIQGAALVMEAKTGNILAMVGGRDFHDSKFNRAVQAGRQAGSTFKPFLYSAAVEKGISLDTPLRDAPIHVPMPFGQPDWEPGNYEGRFSDTVLTIRQGLWKSLNSIAVQVGMMVQPEAVADEARRFGITTLRDADVVPSIFLGAPTVHPIEMVAAYSTFANLGYRSLPRAVTRVEDKNGKLLWQPEVKTVPVLDAATAWTMNQALQGVVTNGTAYKSVYVAGFHIPAGGKTGTTNDNKDTWFIGFTKDLVAGVWVGMDDNTPIAPNAQGGVYAAPAWTDMMLDIYQRRRDPGNWSLTDQALVPVEIDKTTGFLATPFCPPETREVRYFLKGAEPKEFCPVHSPFIPGGGGRRGGATKPAAKGGGIP